MAYNDFGKGTLRIKEICSLIITKKEIGLVDAIYSRLIQNEAATKQVVKLAKIDLLGLFVITSRNSNEQGFRINENSKILLLKIVSITLSHNKLDHKEILLFHNLFGSLIQEIFFLENTSLKKVSEELMSEALECVKLLFESVTEKLCIILYTRENAVRLCKMIYVVAEVLKHKSRKLKTEAIQCLMSMFRISSDVEIDDFLSNMPVARQLADCFSYFLPGIAIALGGVTSEGPIIGDNIFKFVIEAMGKIMTIFLKDYEEKVDPIEDAKAVVLKYLNSQAEAENVKSSDKKEEFLKMQRTRKWFQTSDQHLVSIFQKFIYLANRPTSQPELLKMCLSLIKHCFKNIPLSVHPLIEMVVIMSDSSDIKVATRSKEIFNTPILGERVKQIISEGFHQTFSRIPTIFNGIDTAQQVNILQLTAVSLKLVGNKIKCNPSFREFQRTLLYLCEVEIGTTNIFEVVCQEEMDYYPEVDVGLWKGLKYMRDENVRKELSNLCRVIYEIELFPILSDYLIETVTSGEEKVGAFYLLNQLLNGVKEGKLLTEGSLFPLIMPTFQTYLNNWDVPLEINPDDEECLTLKMLKTNILQAALMCEGVGLMAYHAKGDDHLRPFVYQSMYKILVRAASGHYMLRLAATNALRHMANGLGYKNVTAMFNENMDFFLFYVERGLKKNDKNNDVFEVMEMVMQLGDLSILNHSEVWVRNVLVDSFDRFKHGRLDSYLKVFRVFLRRLISWYEVETTTERIFESLKEKLLSERERHFQVSGAERRFDDFSDIVFPKTDAYTMFMEDLRNRSKDDDDEYLKPKDEPYKKPTPPKPVEITVEILKRSLNFLPSKDTDRKLMVLEILRNGIELIKNHEDELLPVVHLIWSPLVHRFKEADNPVILKFSFILLVAMARASKDFIRNRTSKDVLPSILENLTSLHKQNTKEMSKYTLNYKLQVVILESLFFVIYDTGLLKEDIVAILKVVIPYTNEDQPDSLRASAYSFLTCLDKYDYSYGDIVTDMMCEKWREWNKSSNDNQSKK